MVAGRLTPVRTVPLPRKPLIDHDHSGGEGGRAGRRATGFMLQAKDQQASKVGYLV